jgi:hypothetical protein
MSAVVGTDMCRLGGTTRLVGFAGIGVRAGLSSAVHARADAGELR